MKDKRKNQRIKTENVTFSFNSKRLTYYSGLAPIFKFFDNIGLIRDITKQFQTTMTNATKFKTSQLMLTVIAASLCGISRLNNISIFTSDMRCSPLFGQFWVPFKV